MIVGAICARGGSKGVPRKNIKPLAGVPLIAHTIRCAQASARLDRLVVSTDDEEIGRIAQSYGVEVPFMRPAELARDDSSKWHVFRHLVETLEALWHERIDVLVDLDTGVPLRLPADIDACVEALMVSQADCVVTAYEPARNPYFNMVELDRDGLARVVKQPGEPVVNRQQAPVVYGLSPAVYAIRRDVLWQHEHWSKSRLAIHEIPRERAIDIDSELDFVLVEQLMNMQQEKL